MLAVKIIVLWGIASIGAAAAAAVIAGMRNRDHSAWAAWCFIFPPLLLVLLLLPRGKGQRPRRPSWMDAATYATMPETLTVHELRFTVDNPGFRTENVLWISS